MEVEQPGDHDGLQQYYITKIEELQVSMHIYLYMNFIKQTTDLSL